MRPRRALRRAFRIRATAAWALLAGTAIAAQPAATPRALPQAAPVGSAPAAPAPPRSVTGEAVRIEGKLYSPQALFILTRSVEPFGRDAIVPHYLEPAASLSYQLCSELLLPPAAAAQPAREP